ncbi:MAG: sigma-70 family RNA polymerase sigma factor [Terriglobales bacterium]
MARYAQLSSSELVRACAGSKDEEAWVEFIRRFQVVIAAAVLRTARRWGEPSRQQLDDLVQETYLKLCENDSSLLRSFQPQCERSIYGFLKVVAANVVHDRFKSALAAKRGAAQTQAISEPVQIDPKTAAEGSFDAVSQRLQLERIDRILTQVTAGKDQERKRTIFWLRHRQGLTASEIAAIRSIGLTTEGVESMLMRLADMIRGHVSDSNPHREVKVLTGQNRSKRLGS